MPPQENKGWFTRLAWLLLRPLFVGIVFLSEISKNGMRVGGSLPLSIIQIIKRFLKQKLINRQNMDRKMNVGTDEVFFKKN